MKELFPFFQLGLKGDVSTLHLGRNMTHLSISSNQLRGTLPSATTHMDIFDVSKNMISGALNAAVFPRTDSSQVPHSDIMLENRSSTVKLFFL